MVIQRHDNPKTSNGEKSSRSNTRGRAGKPSGRRSTRKIVDKDEKKNATQEYPSQKDEEDIISSSDTSQPLQQVARKRRKREETEPIQIVSHVAEELQATGDDAPLTNLSTTNVHTLLDSLEHASKAQWPSEQWHAEVQPLIINLRTVLSRRHPTDTSTDLPAIPSLDPFNDTLNFASEARVKQEVFGLNDSLDNLIMTILEGAVQVIKQSQIRLRAPSFKQHQKAVVARPSGKKESPLFIWLQTERHTDETRGFLLDALLHGKFVNLIFNALFDCHVVGNAFESSGMLENVWDTVRQRESWNVAQRWRAITSAAASPAAILGPDLFGDSVTKCCAYIEFALNEAYLMPESRHVFKRVVEEAVPGLHSLFAKAHSLSLQIRQDIVTSRLSITRGYSPTDPPSKFDLLTTTSVWADMGATKKDDVLGSYRFGLMQEHENGETTILIQPEVVTTALHRHLFRRQPKG